MRFFLICLFFFTLFFSCQDPEPEKECRTCKYVNHPTSTCDSVETYTFCVLGPYENSLQSYIEITHTCDGETISSIEEIGFMEDYLAEQINAGAQCDE